MLLATEDDGIPFDPTARAVPDTVRTAVNVEGDIIGSVVVQRFADRA